MGDNEHYSATAERWRFIEEQLERIRMLEFTDTSTFLHCCTCNYYLSWETRIARMGNSGER